MFCNRILRHIIRSQNSPQIRNFRAATILYCDNKSDNVKDVSVRVSFETVENKTKNAYLDMVKIFIDRDINRRGHVEFIYSALRNMESFGVQKDLEVYKALVDVLPKGRFIPQNIFQAEFMHYPKQQQCIIDLLEQMEDNGVMPDFEMEDILMNIFGRRGYPLRKFWRMMYWMPKFKNLSPWIVPNPPPDDAFQLAKLAIERISSVDNQAEIKIFQTADIEDSVDDTWIVSSQSPTQKKLVSSHNCDEPIYVEGSFRVWLRSRSVNYFILRANPKPLPPQEPEDSDDVSNIKFPLFSTVPPKGKKIAVVPSVHEQADGIIYGVCATGTSSKDSLLSWIRHLEKENPALKTSPIVFTLQTAEKEIATMDISEETAVKEM